MTASTVEPPAGATPEGVPAPKDTARRSGRYGWLAWPVLAVLSVLILVPLLAMVYGSFKVGGPFAEGEAFAVSAVADVYTSARYLWTLAGTLGLAIVVAGLAVIVGTGFAWLLARTDVRFRSFFEIVIIAPLFLSPFVGAIAWVTLAAPNSGMLNVNLRHLFGPDLTLVNIMTVPGIIWVLTIYYIPYSYMFVSASLRNMDPSLEDASYINGQGHISTARRITLPIIKPAMSAAFFFIAVLAAGVFSVPGVLGASGAFTPLAVRVYRAVAIFPSDYATGAALGTMLFWFTLAGIYLYRKAIADAHRYVTVSARGYRPRLIRLGRWRRPAMGLFVGYFLLAVALPYTALTLVALSPFAQTDLTRLDLTLANFLDVATSNRVLDATQNTLVLGLGAPTLCVILGLVVAFTVQRSKGRTAAAVDYVATLPIAIPGIVFATGMVWAYILTPVYATLWILLIAYVASYIPHAARLTANGLMQIDKSLEEASTINGARLGRTLRRVTFPLTKPALLSAWVLIFIFTVREINAAIILYSPRSNVLSVLTWDYIESGVVRNAAVVGILQTLLLLTGVFLARFVFRVKLTSTAI